LGAPEPRHLAEQLALLKEGAIATAQVRAMPEAAQISRDMAAGIIEAALGETSQTAEE